MFILTCIVGLIGWVLVLIYKNKSRRLQKQIDTLKKERIEINDWRVGDQLYIKYNTWSELDISSIMYIIDVFPDNTIAVGDKSPKDMFKANKKAIIKPSDVEYNQTSRNRRVDAMVLDNTEYRQALKELQIQFYDTSK